MGRDLHLVKAYAWMAEDFKVLDTILSYFANFIKAGNPNVDNLAEWIPTKTGDSTPPLMIIDTKSKTVKDLNDARYEFINKAFKINVSNRK